MAEEEEEARGCSTEEDESGQFIGSNLVLIRMPQPCSLALRDSKKMLGEWGIKKKSTKHTNKSHCGTGMEKLRA